MKLSSDMGEAQEYNNFLETFLAHKFDSIN